MRPRRANPHELAAWHVLARSCVCLQSKENESSSYKVASRGSCSPDNVHTKCEHKVAIFDELHSGVHAETRE